MAHPVRFRNQSQNEFQKVFNQLCYTRMSWEVWEDFTVLTATAISNALDQTGPVHDKREQEYIRTIKKYGKKEQILFPQLFALTVQGLEDNPKQDFLGEMFMALNLGNHWRGQVFTPYHVCEMMAKMIMSEDVVKIKEENKQNIFVAPSCTMTFHPMIKKIKEIVKSEEYGKVCNFSYHSGQYLPDWHPWENVNDFYVSNRKTGGAREIVPFELTWIVDILGFPKAIKGYYRKTTDLGCDIEDSYVCSIDYGNILGSL